MPRSRSLARPSPVSSTCFWDGGPTRSSPPTGRTRATSRLRRRSTRRRNTSQRISGDVVDELRRLKASDGRPLQIWGSRELLQTLISADLIDEYRIWVFPLVLGEGKRLFENGVPSRGFSLVATRSTPRG